MQLVHDGVLREHFNLRVRQPMQEGNCVSGSRGSMLALDSMAPVIEIMQKSEPGHQAVYRLKIWDKQV